MKILQLANFYGPSSGGLRICVDELGGRYAAAGHQVLLIVPGDRDAVRTVGGRTVVTIESPLVPALGGYRAVVDLGAVRNLVAEFGPDVVELSDKTTLARAVLHPRPHTPVVLVSHERLDHVLGAQLPRFLPVRGTSERVVRWLVERVDAVVCASRYAAEEIERSRRAHVVHIPLGIDLETFRPPETPRPDATPTLVYAGRLSPEKQPQVAIDTLRRLHQRGLYARLVVAGSGPLDRNLRAASLGLPVEFVGQIDGRAELAAILGAADVALAPGPFETFGLAALEAMASGTPVVVAASGALRELVTIGAGVVAGAHVDGFADAAAALLTGDRHEQRRLARRRAEEFSWDRTASSFLELQEQLLDARASVQARSGTAR